MKFTAGFAINSLFCFCVRRLSRAGLGTTVLGLCVAFANAETDVQIESVTTSPRGTFRIAQERKRDARKGEWMTTAWITLAADPSQRSPQVGRLATRTGGISSFLRTSNGFTPRCTSTANCRA